MKRLLPLVLSLVASGTAYASDVVVTSKKHTDAYEMAGQAQPAKDSTTVQWIGADRLRAEDGERVTIVRADLKKMYVIDPATKTYSTLDLPPDMKKYMPAEIAPMMEQMMAEMKLTVTPTTETKTVGQWNATKYTVEMTLPRGGSMKQEVWATKDVAVDSAAMQEMRGSILAATPMGGSSWAELKKIDGLPVLTLRSTTMMGTVAKESEEVTSIEQKDAPAGHYDVPEGFTEKPFDPMSGMQTPGRGRRGGR